MNLSTRINRIATVSLIASVTGCISTNHQNFQPSQLPAIGDDKGTYLKPDGTETQWTNKEVDTFVSLSEKAQSDPKHIREFVYVGLNVSDQIANRWFRVQFAQDVQSRYSNNTFNVATGGITAILGVTNASHKAISLLGAGTTATNAQWKNYEASYLLSSALPLVLEKLREFRKERRNEILSRYDSDGQITYHEAVDELRNYHQTASREVIKRFIEKSAELAEFTTKYDAEGSLKGIQVLPLNTALFSLFYPKMAGTFSKNDLIQIYALVSQARPNNLITAIEASPTGKHLSDLVQSISGTAEGKAELIRLISGLNGLLLLEEDVRKKLKIVDAAAKAEAASAKAAGDQASSPASGGATPGSVNAETLEKLTTTSKLAVAAAEAEKAKEAQKRRDIEATKAALAETETQIERQSSLAKASGSLLLEKKALLDETRKVLQAALAKESALKEEAERLKKEAQAVAVDAARAADDAEGAWWSKNERAEKARRLAERARSSEAEVQAKITDFAQAVATAKIEMNKERELSEAVQVLEKNVTEAKAAELSAKAEENKLRTALGVAEAAAKMASESAMNAARRASEAITAERKAREDIAAAIAKLNAATAEPLTKALINDAGPATSSQPRVQSVR